MARRIPVLLFVAVVVGVGLLAPAASADQSEPPKEDYYELHKLLVDTLDEIERNYVKQITRRELIEAAIKGLLDELDPYSAYIGPDNLDRFRSTVDGNFGGIGIQIDVRNRRLIVISPLAGTPAFRAGILAGDQIIEINGESTKGIDVDEAVRRLKGDAGSEVTLTVRHPGKAEPEKITVTREIIRVKTVLGDHRKDDETWNFMLDPQKQIGYVRITAFSRDTARQLRDALDELNRDHLRGLIVDLRFNPGGLLSSAIEVADLFVSQGRIVSTKGRDADEEERFWDAHQEGSFEGFPMVVLVNRFTASAGEIVSACLQDHDRAVIMGERTWGKGSVQNVIPLEKGRSALKLTTASYLRPSGKNIHRFADADEDDEWGVSPNDGYELKLTDEEMLALVHDRGRRDVVRPKAEPNEAGPAEQSTAEKGAPDQPPSQSEPGAASKPPQPDQTTTDRQDEPATADKQPAEQETSELVDAQLQMAIDYLTAELARAD
jgi:carboxyl-terminal processing protease